MMLACDKQTKVQVVCCVCVKGDKSVSPSVRSPLNNSGGSGGGASGSVTPSSSASLKGFSKSALPPSLGQHHRYHHHYIYFPEIKHKKHKQPQTNQCSRKVKPEVTKCLLAQLSNI